MWSVVHLYRCTLVETYTQEPVSASRFVVCTHNLSSGLSVVEDGLREVIHPGTFLHIEYAPPFSYYYLILSMNWHCLMLYISIEHYTFPSEVRFGAGHSLWVYFLNILDSMLLVGVVDVCRWWGGVLTAVGLLVVHDPCCCILPVLPIAGFSSSPWEVWDRRA